MFKSRKRPLIIPQYEHGRMAGYLAQNWGNDHFDRPALDFDAFVQGVALHDWHYRFADNWSITELDEETWMMIANMGLEMRLENPTSDIVAKMHLRRLISYGPTSAERRAITQKIDATIDSRLPDTGHDRTAFQWADKITQFCDFVVFHFAFEQPFTRTTTICRRVGSDQETEITYQISGDTAIIIDPWPFAMPTLSGILIGYEAQGYPQELKPRVIPFQISPPGVSVI